MLDDRLPILEVGRDCIVSKMGDVTIALELTKPELFTLGEGDYRLLCETFARAIKVLPEDSVLHMQDVYRKDRFRANMRRGTDGRNWTEGADMAMPWASGDMTDGADGQGKNDEGACDRMGGLDKGKDSHGSSEDADGLGEVHRSVDGRDFLKAASDGYFEGRAFLRHRCFVFLTKRPAGRRKVSSGTSALLRKTLVPEGTLDTAGYQQLEDAMAHFSRILSDSGLIGIRRIRGTELVSSGKKAGLIERYCFLLDDEEAPVLQDVQLKDGIRIGDQEVCYFSLADLEHFPARCSPSIGYARFSTERNRYPIGMTAGLGMLLPCNHTFNQYILIGNPTDHFKRLERRRTRLQSLSGYSRGNTLAQEATADFLNEAITRQQPIVHAHFNVMCWSDQAEELSEIKGRVSAALTGIDVTPHLETIGAPQLWWAAIPGNGGELPENECVELLLEQACCFYNYESMTRSSTSDLSLRFGDRSTGRPIQVDFDDEPRKSGMTQNDHTIVLSGSGGGKSFLVNHLCKTYSRKKVHTVIIDIGHSYRRLCELSGGYYFSYDAANPFRFNPFFVRRGETLDEERKEGLKNLLMALWKRPDEVQTRSEYVALSNALQGYYRYWEERPDWFLCFDSFYEWMAGPFRTLLEEQGVRQKEFDLDGFLYVVKPFYKGGEYDFLLNATEQLDLKEQPFIVFELDGIKDSMLFPIVTMVIMDVCMTKVRGLRGVRKMIVIEEGWKAVANAGMAQSILYWIKTLRKFMGKLVFVSQEIEDVIASPIIKQAILANTDCRILLDHSKYANRFDEIQAFLGITDKQKREILSINKGHEPGRVYKDFWYSLGADHSRVYRLETSLEEYLAYSSSEEDKVRVEDYAKRCGSLEKGIKVLAEEMRRERKDGSG